MPVYTLERSQTVPLSQDECWCFFSDPMNLAKLTPPSLGFRVESEVPTEIHPGLMIRYTVSPLFKIPTTWVSEISHVQKPNYFVDEQRVGPYAVWHHEHFFRALAPDRTEVRDRVHYVPPFGPLGAILNRFLIRPQLERIFAFREKRLGELAAN